MRIANLFLAVAAVGLLHTEAKAAPPKLDSLVLPMVGLGDKVPEGVKPPRIAAWLFGGLTASSPAYTADDGSRVYTAKLTSKVIGFASDKKAAWVTADLRLDQRCSASGCDKSKPGSAHVTLLVEDGTPWQPVLVHIAEPATEKQATESPPDKIDRKIDAGAEDVVKLFESTIGDPAAFAGTVSARKEAVLYGSRRQEKYVGGAAMKATLKKWGLTMKVRDGVQAGVTASKTLAWVAANIDATPAKKKDAKPTPYRATFIYEQTPKGWQLVSAQFSAYVSTI